MAEMINHRYVVLSRREKPGWEGGGGGGATSSFLVDRKGGLGCARIGTNFTQAGNLKLESFQGYR